MEDTNGIEVIPRFLRVLPEARIIMLTMYDLDIYRQAADAAGAKGYVIKKDLFKTLIPTIQQVLNSSVENSAWEYTGLR